MPPLADDPEESRPYFRRLRELAEAHGLAQLSMGTTQDYLVAVEEGATLVTGRRSSVPGLRSVLMSLGDVWHRTLVYFGIAEEYDEAWDEEYLSERGPPACRRARGARLRGAVEHECQAAPAPPGVRPRLRRLDVR